MEKVKLPAYKPQPRQGKPRRITEVLSIRLPSELLQKLRKHCFDNKTGPTQIIRDFLEKMLQ